jgi:inner membrane protein involved in colicin E2 resistance
MISQILIRVITFLCSSYIQLYLCCIMYSKENKKALSFTLKAFDLIMWYQLGSNQRHKDFQSFALPTEL